jgi:hypothetical protein
MSTSMAQGFQETGKNPLILSSTELNPVSDQSIVEKTPWAIRAKSTSCHTDASHPTPRH